METTADVIHALIDLFVLYSCGLHADTPVDFPFTVKSDFVHCQHSWSSTKSVLLVWCCCVAAAVVVVAVVVDGGGG